MAHFDPAYAGSGMARTSKLDHQVFDTFVNDRERLVEIAAEIKSLAVAVDSSLLPEPDEAEVEAVEGRLLYRRHRRRERDPSITRRKKDMVHKQTGRLACEVCDVDFSEMYGDLGSGLGRDHRCRFGRYWSRRSGSRCGVRVHP
ncbi:MAG: hypothetical protein GY773_16710 [Actinomycetia bacterium]|nr:hypothetical protein [Actinomycetes bacterium]